MGPRSAGKVITTVDGVVVRALAAAGDEAEQSPTDTQLLAARIRDVVRIIIISRLTRSASRWS
jgi:hypothetical protein